MSVAITPLGEVVQAIVTVAVASPAVPDRDIMAGPCRLLKITAASRTGTAWRIRLYDHKSPTLGTTISDLAMSVPITTKKTVSFGKGIPFASGLSVVATEPETGVDVVVNLLAQPAIITLDILPGLS